MTIIKSGIWSIKVTNHCSRCHMQLPDDKAMLCEKCRSLQQNLESENRKEQKAKHEIDEMVRAASLGVDVMQTSGITYYTTRGNTYQNISGAVFETGKSVREIHNMVRKLGIPKRYDPLKHHALVFTAKEIRQFKTYNVNRGYAIINGINFVSSSHLSIVIGNSRQSINQRARAGDWPNVIMRGMRWNQVQGTEDYLAAKQRQKDAVELRRDTVRLCSDLNVPRVEQ